MQTMRLLHTLITHAYTLIFTNIYIHAYTTNVIHLLNRYTHIHSYTYTLQQIADDDDDMI